MTSDAGTRGGLILTVCTANVCRSPLAALHLQESLREGALAGVDVTSAGVRGLDAAPMCAVARERLDDGRRGEGHRSRRLTREHVEVADLVLTMEGEQRGAVARLAPGQQGKVFTLREAAAMIEAIGEEDAPAPASVSELVDRMRALRGIVRPPVAIAPAPRGLRRLLGRRNDTPEDDGLSIEDGHNIDVQAHMATVDEVRVMTDAIATVLNRFAA